jgi:3D (Asp-Asp-Asp) domain-containing protein
MRRGIPSIACVVLLWAAGYGVAMSDMSARTGVSSPEVRVSFETDSSRDSSIPEGYVYWKTVRARVTAYDPSKRCCGSFADGKTSIGLNAWKLTGCAAYPKAIPYGTLVYVPGVGYRTVDDTGAQMRKSWQKGVYHVDLRMKYHYEARRWGNRYLCIRLYRKNA